MVRPGQDQDETDLLLQRHCRLAAWISRTKDLSALFEGILDAGPVSHPVRQSRDEITKEGNRAVKLVTKMLTLGGRSESEFGKMELREVVTLDQGCSARKPGSSEIIQGHGRIMLVDDEEMVVRVTSEGLRRSGFDRDCYTDSHQRPWRQRC